MRNITSLAIHRSMAYYIVYVACEKIVYALVSCVIQAFEFFEKIPRYNNTRRQWKINSCSYMYTERIASIYLLISDVITHYRPLRRCTYARSSCKRPLNSETGVKANRAFVGDSSAALMYGPTARETCSRRCRGKFSALLLFCLGQTDDRLSRAWFISAHLQRKNDDLIRPSLASSLISRSWLSVSQLEPWFRFVMLNNGESDGVVEAIYLFSYVRGVLSIIRLPRGIVHWLWEFLVMHSFTWANGKGGV